MAAISRLRSVRSQSLMKCVNCKTVFPRGATFCLHCGASIEVTQTHHKKTVIRCLTVLAVLLFLGAVGCLAYSVLT